MKGAVSWASEEWESHGHVKACVQDGSRLNMTFDCHDGGEGQITLAITTAEQFASGCFVYGPGQVRTYAGVMGKLTWQPGALQFEGQWDDQGTDIVWSFSIDIDGFDFAKGTIGTDAAPDPEMESLDEILDTLERRYLTELFDPDVAPSLPGVYRVVPPHWADSRLAYAIWNGTCWSGSRRHVKTLADVGCHEHAAHGGHFWRGLTQEGVQRVLLLLEGAQRHQLKTEYRKRLADLRNKETETARERARAYDDYEQRVARIDRSGLSMAEQQRLRAMLEQLVHADFEGPAETIFDETVPRLIEDAQASLLAALSHNDERVEYWRNYVRDVIDSDPGFASELTSKGLVVGYGRDMQARLGKHDSMRPLPGSYGTKRRKR